MKKKLIVLTCLAGFLMVYGCSPRRSEPLKGRNFMASQPEIAHGEKLYMAHCQKCHPAGEGGLGIAINSNPAPGFVKRFQIRHGLGVMPAFSKTELSKKDLKDISSYMHAWKHY